MRELVFVSARAAPNTTTAPARMTFCGMNFHIVPQQDESLFPKVGCSGSTARLRSSVLQHRSVGAPSPKLFY